MKKKSLIILILLFSILSGFSQTAQPKKIESAIKITIVGFLKWYKENEPKLTTSAIVKGYNEDTIKKDSILRVDMRSVDEYLSNFRKSNFVSDSFLGALRFKYKSVSDSLTKYPVIDYFGPVPGLECDLLFGFEPEEILDHADEGKISKIFFIYNKALVKFDISKYNQMIFCLTRSSDQKWVIDNLDYDITNF